MDHRATHRIARDDRWVLSVWNDDLAAWEPTLAFESREEAEEIVRDVGGVLAPDQVQPFREAKRAFEIDYATRVLRTAGGEVKRAAQLAGKHRRDFYHLVRRTGVDWKAIRKEMRRAVSH